MNVMFIISSLCGGGAERVTVTLASELSKTDNVTIVAYRYVDNPYPVSDNVNIEYLNIADGKSPFEKALNSVRRIRRLKRIKTQNHIDCSISMLYSPNFENVMSRTKERVIVSLRKKSSVHHQKKIERVINRLTAKHADLTVALSKNVMTDQINEFGTPKNKIITIYNPCDISSIQKKSHEIINDGLFSKIRAETEHVVITAGRLTEQKGQWHMVRAFSKVVEHYPNAKLVILGQGKLEDYLRQIIGMLNLENNVYLMGFRDNPYAFMAKSDIFAFTSLYEGFGNILLEAMACGLPIVSCDCDAGPRELLAPKENSFSFANDIELAQYGILTPVMNGNKGEKELSQEENLFADALLKLMDDKLLLNHYSEMSRERIKDFTVASITDIWRGILK